MTFVMLLTCVGGELSPQVIRTLKSSRRHDVRVVGVDMRDDASGRYFVDSFYTVPAGDSDEYIGVLSDIVAREDVDLVLPTSDPEALALSRHRDRIERGRCTLACADADTLAVVSDKARCYEALAERNLPVPFWRRVDDTSVLPELVRELVAERGELVVKSASETGGRGTCVIREGIRGTESYLGGREMHMDLQTFLDEYVAGFFGTGTVVAMERLVAPAYDVDMLAWRGETKRVVARRRRDPTGAVEGHIIVDVPELLDLGRRLIGAFNLSWLYDCDVMLDGEGRPGILEINPRPSGSIATAMAAGVPLLEDLISLAKGETIPDVAYPRDYVVVAYKTLQVVPP